jgi:hypothetical protein
MMRALILAVLVLFVSTETRAGELPLADAHIHYSHDAWQSVPPEEAVGLLRAAGLRRAFVSS